MMAAAAASSSSSSRDPPSPAAASGRGRNVIDCSEIGSYNPNAVDMADCYFPNDGYNYNQHLREPGKGYTIEVVEKKGKKSQKQRKAVIREPPKVVVGRRLQDLAGGATLVSEEGIFDKDPRDWTAEEREVFEALEDAEEFDELEDDFVLNLPGAKNLDMDDIVWGGHKPEFVDAGLLSDFMSEMEAGTSRKGSAYGDWEKRSVASSKRSGMTAPLLTGDRRQVLESKFERILEEYEEEEIGDLEEEEVEEIAAAGGAGLAMYEEIFDEHLIEKGKRPEDFESLEGQPGGELDEWEDEEGGEEGDDEEDEEGQELRRPEKIAPQVMEDTLEDGQKVTLVKMPMSAKARRRRREMERFWGIEPPAGEEEEDAEAERALAEALPLESIPEEEKDRIADLLKKQEEGEGNEELVEEEDGKEKEKWDCETILTTKSNLYNRPHKIGKPPSEAKGGKIKIGGKLGVPVDFLPDRSRQDAAADAADPPSLSQVPEEREGEDEEEDEDEDDEDTVVGPVSTYRRKGETAEERKERKAAVKEAKRRVRELKKQTKEEFKAETKKAHAARGRGGYDIKPGVRTFAI
uniref:Protein LTV1 homolog n=1 Tax=Chromera velia CCMP2878 TaxID=1169474 RepID=A0A0G4IAF3_9ALVE|mmetsp:Transcript_43231/g.85260  ORF Transcript_43231/g.85260 Transcript_43231/m.85260 type:complete len:577 (+) Transcript_43231:109-1839(+)|eukprot:Cvel_12529.t1-p1 / transcript=Cvel_12529.t1 / gene=Cvel_12529 / organism=Chromera_velia_CCMP2878 / gene_product=hypothetical protein / transcript_product=hypothetical protein / location=Cvel_scaffold822:55799-60679(-) / protein_length=576 / sequence_SO=supercontig / SO=protein_coding / is_pseudo=false